MVIDSGLDGLVTIRGLNISLLSATIELHGLEVGESSFFEHTVAACRLMYPTRAALTISSRLGRGLRP